MADFGISFAISMAISLAMSAIQYAMTPSPQDTNETIEGRRQSEFSLAGGSSYGVAIPLVYGRARLPGNLVWMSDVREIRSTTVYSRTQEGKKEDTTATTTQVSYSYRCDLVLQLCKGPITGGICKIFADKQLVYANVIGENEVSFKHGTFTLYKGTSTQTLPSAVPTSYRDTVVVYIEDFDMTYFGNRLPIFEIEISANGSENPVGRTITTAPISAVTIIEDVCERAGMVSSDYYIGDITGDFIGFITPQGPLISGLERVINASKAVSIYSDDKIKFKGRAVDPVATIPAADLRYLNDDEGDSNAALLIIRADEKTMPSSVIVSFIDPSRDHDKNTQTARLNNPVYVNELGVDFGIAMSPDAAAQLAEVYLYSAWQERISYRLNLGPKYLYLEPGDAIRVEAPFGTIMMVILKIDYGANGTLIIDAASYNRGTLVSNKVGAGFGVNNPGNPSSTNSTFQYFNAPMISPVQNAPGVFVFINGSSPEAWAYANVYISRNGIDYTLKDVVSTPGFFGRALNALPDHTSALVDVINHVDIEINDGELSSTTLDDLLADQTLNLFFVGDEMVQAANVSLIAAKTYRLSTLLRGRFGTEHHTGSHAIDEKVAVYGSGFYMGLSPSSDYNTTLYLKLVSNGQDYGSIATEHSFVADFRTLLPYCPVNVDAVLSSGDVVITWNRRSRYGDELPSTGAEVPLFEATEEYQVDILNSVGDVVRTLSTTTQTATYTAAQQIADGGYISVIRCKVYQLSAEIGRGTPSKLLVKTL